MSKSGFKSNHSMEKKKDTYSTHTGTMFKENPIEIIIFLLLMSLVIPKPFYLP